MVTNLEQRLRRLEKVGASALPSTALIITAPSQADADRQMDEAIADGRHKPGWPAMIVIGSPERTP